MKKPDTIAWHKKTEKSDHGPSATHLEKKRNGGEVETWCGRSVSTDREPVPEDEAGPECQRCQSTFRRHLLREETVGLDELADLGAITPAAAELLGEAEISHTEVDGSGEWGRITKDDAVAAVKARKGAE